MPVGDARLAGKYAAGKLQGIIAEGPEIYVGANYAWSIGRKNIIFIAGDYPTEVRTAIENGKVYGTADQSPVTEGVNGVIAAVNGLRGRRFREAAGYVHPPAQRD